ncbi:MAG: protein tyrosine/serine phosphatase, partial [Solirubrobacterales bacterium]|nr:protein tyrosine/serine phosphatase [Solirubrobacterales bacterium]
ADPGGVVFHCGIGRDRTGMIAMLLLSLAGVAPDDIADDYELSAGRLPPLFIRRGEDDHRPAIDALLAREGTTLRQIIADTLQNRDVATLLRSGGLTDGDVGTLHTRLLGPDASRWLIPRAAS